jgi:sterol desaturase/sphingolipid hydroxylase (fatty acid hydroxylase superfamily)
MKPIPLLDYVAFPIFVALFAVLFWMQRRYPLRRAQFSAFTRTLRNLVFSAPGFAAMRLAMIPIPLAVAIWAGQRGFGLFYWLHLPCSLAGGLGFFIMDWTYYWWHYANHVVPFFWRFHNVHHTDLDLDVSTAARFHFGEILLSVPFRVLVIGVFGIPLIAVFIFEIIFECATMFHHSNWRLPLGLERMLNRAIVTPRMHGVHHSIVQGETNSNWGTILCWWDILHCTLRRDVAQDDITIGVPAYRHEHELTFAKLWALPFRQQREWRLPDGNVPTRQRRSMTELQP